MPSATDLLQLSPDQLRAFATEWAVERAALLEQVEHQAQEIEQHKRDLHHKSVLNDKLTHELAILRRHRFGRSSETLNPAQASLLDELVESDIAAIEAELPEPAPAVPASTKPAQQPRLQPLPPELPRTVIAHEPDNTQCRCGCQLVRIGEDVSEKLDYTPGEFTVERHVRGPLRQDSCRFLYNGSRGQRGDVWHVMARHSRHEQLPVCYHRKALHWNRCRQNLV